MTLAPSLGGKPAQNQGILRSHESTILERPQKLSRRVAREVLELADYDIEIHHLKGSANRQADVLSRRPDFDQGEGDNEGVVVLPNALFARSTELEDREEQNEGVVSLWVDPHQLKKIDGVWQNDGRVVATAKSPYTKQLIHDHHDLPIHGHPGISWTMDLVQRRYWWLQLRQDVIQYI